MQRGRYGWTEHTELQRARVLDYTFNVPSTEDASWVWVECNGQTLLTPLLLSSSYDAPSGTACSAQLTKRSNPSQTDGNLTYGNLQLRALEGVGDMEATISATQLHPDGGTDGGDSRHVPVNCQGLVLPSAKCFRSRREVDTFDKDLERLLAAAAAGPAPDLAATCIRMNHSLIPDDVANTKFSIVTAGHRSWEDASSAAYVRTVRARQVSDAPKFVVCTSNRVWRENGGDPDFTVCCLKQSCVDQINKVLPLLRVSSLRERAMGLMRTSIAGPMLSPLSELIFCCEDANSVLSPTVLLRKPTRGKVVQGGALSFESGIVMLDTQIETEILDNPSLFGDMLLLRIQSNESISLQAVGGAAQATAVPRPLRRAGAGAPTNIPFVTAVASFGRCSTRLKAHALRDFVCAIDLTDSHLLTQQTSGNTYQTQTTLRPENELAIRTKLFDLRERYTTFRAFARLVGDTRLPECLALVETDTGHIISSAAAVQKQLDDVDPLSVPTSRVGKQIYENLRQATAAFAAACAPFRHAAAEHQVGTHLAPLRHSKQLGRVQRVCLLASGTCNSPTNNRALLLVHTYSPPDVCLLFIDRHLGTDPEYFSSDMRMDTPALKRASSVRNALGIAPTLPFYVQSITRMSSGNTNVFTNKNGTLVHGKQHPLFAVRWKTDISVDQWHESTFSAFTGNRVRVDDAPETAIGRIITVTPGDTPAHSTFNQNWSIRLVHTRPAKDSHLSM